MPSATAFGLSLPRFDTPGLSMVGLPQEGLLHLRLIGGEKGDGSRLEALLGPLPGPLKSTRQGAQTLLWLAPGQWLLDLPHAELPAMKRELERCLAEQGLAADWSDQMVRISLQGSLWRDVMAAGSTVDFHDKSFAIGQVTRTSLGRVETILERRTEEQARLFFERSMARYAWLWLTTVGRQVAALALA